MIKQYFCNTQVSTDWIVLFTLTLNLATLNKDAMRMHDFQPIRLLDPGCLNKLTYLMANRADPDVGFWTDLDLIIVCLSLLTMANFNLNM